MPRAGAGLQRPQARELRAPASHDPGARLWASRPFLAPGSSGQGDRVWGLRVALSCPPACLRDGRGSDNKGKKQTAQACVSPGGASQPLSGWRNTPATRGAGEGAVGAALCGDILARWCRGQMTAPSHPGLPEGRMPTLGAAWGQACPDQRPSGGPALYHNQASGCRKRHLILF